MPNQFELTFCKCIAPFYRTRNIFPAESVSLRKKLDFTFVALGGKTMREDGCRTMTKNRLSRDEGYELN